MSENINEIAGVEPSFKIDELKFNEKGLIPAIVQDHYSKKVLMMAWMNKESLEISLREKKTSGNGAYDLLQPQPSGTLEKG